tara:strand:- start:500 stop:682 length:183 start_codon:yes stop_codon:yes gene_type:complete
MAVLSKLDRPGHTPNQNVEAREKQYPLNSKIQNRAALDCQTLEKQPLTQQMMRKIQTVEL